MLTALVLQLIQCVVDLPDSLSEKSANKAKSDTNKISNDSSKSSNNDSRSSSKSNSKKSDHRNKRHNHSEETNKKEESNKKEETGSKSEDKTLNIDKDVLVCGRYETAMQTAYSFLSVFLSKTGSKEEIDYRPLFENFVQVSLLIFLIILYIINFRPCC